jgi:hypothetical protein
MEKKRLFAYVTGASAIATAFNPKKPFRLIAITLHLSAAGTTSENFSVTLDAGEGSVYDTVQYQRDLSVGSITNLVVEFGDNFEFEEEDHLDIAWTNTEARTYGLKIVYELF